MNKLSNIIICLGLLFILFVSLASASFREMPVREGEDVVIKQEVVIATLKDVPAAMPAQAAWDLQQGKIEEWKAPAQNIDCQYKFGFPMSTECKQLQAAYWYSEGKFSSRIENLPPISRLQVAETFIMFGGLFWVLIFGPVYCFNKRTNSDNSNFSILTVAALNMIFLVSVVSLGIIANNYSMLKMYINLLILCGGISYCLALIMGRMWKKKLPEAQEVATE